MLKRLVRIGTVFLLTPLREGRLEFFPPARQCHPISTHAPAGGATFSAAALVSPSRISTHAPAGGATHVPLADVPLTDNFYSRPCGRGDPRRRTPAPRLPSISTHAPAGGATKAANVSGWITAVFLLTPLREGRRNRYRMDTHPGHFYSRPCGRGD